MAMYTVYGQCGQYHDRCMFIHWPVRALYGPLVIGLGFFFIELLKGLFVPVSNLVKTCINSKD